MDFLAHYQPAQLHKHGKIKYWRIISAVMSALCLIASCYVYVDIKTQRHLFQTMYAHDQLTKNTVSEKTRAQLITFLRNEQAHQSHCLADLTWLSNTMPNTIYLQHCDWQHAALTCTGHDDSITSLHQFIRTLTAQKTHHSITFTLTHHNLFTLRVSTKP